MFMLKIIEKSKSPAGVSSHRLRLLLAVFMLLGAARSQTLSRNTLQGETPPALAAGAPAGSYPLSEFDNVNLYNGNLNFSLPLIKIGGRGEAAYAMTLPIEQHWHVDHSRGCLSGAVSVDPAGGSCDLAQDSWTPIPDWWTNADGVGNGRPRSAGTLIGRFQGKPNPAASCQGTESFIETTTVLTFTAPDGTEYSLYDKLNGGGPLSHFNGGCDSSPIDRGTVFVTTDGTSATFVSDSDIQDNPFLFTNGLIRPTGNLYLSSGLVYRIVNGDILLTVDRNGNEVRFSYAGHLLASVTDTLGRVISLSYAANSNPPVAYDTVTFPGFNGATRTIKIWYSSLRDALRSDSSGTGPLTNAVLFPEMYAPAIRNFDSIFGGPNRVVNPTVMSAVELPDGRRFRFSYDPYLELARVDLPTGGAYEYDYSSGAAASSSGAFIDGNSQWQIYRRVHSKRVYADGQSTTPDQVQTFANVENADGTTTVTVKNKKPDGTLISKSDHLFFGTVTSGYLFASIGRPFNEGKEFKTVDYDSDGVTPLRTVLQNWQQAPYPACQITSGSPPFPFSQGFPYNPRNLGTTTTLETGQVSKVTYQYDCFNNVTETDEFDYGATTASRVTLNTYLTSQTVGGTSVDYIRISPNPSLTPTIHLRRLLTSTTIEGIANGSLTGTLTPVVVTNYNYDEDGAPITDDPGIVGHNSGFSTAYRTRGNETSLTTAGITKRSTYDIAGNVVSTTDPNSNVTAYTYDATGGAFAFVNSITFPIPGSHGSGSAMTINKTNDFSTGLLTSFTDLNHQVTSYDYTDPLDRPVSVTHPDGGSTTFIYGDTVGDLNVHTITALDSSRNMESYTYLDGLGRKTRGLELDGTSGTPWIATDTGYDALGRVATVTHPHRIGQLASRPDDCSTVFCTTTAYDAISRVISVTTPDRQSFTAAYTGNRKRTTDQVGNSRDEFKDALGRLVEVTENPTNVGGYGSPMTAYAYDALNNLLCVHQKGTDTTPYKACNDATVPASWRPRNFTYDSLSRMLTSNDPESGTVQYSYDNNGNLLTKQDLRGIIITLQYDRLNREIARGYKNDPANIIPCPSDPTQFGCVEHFYDGQGTPGAANALGRLSRVTSVDPSSGSYSFDGYDAMGRVLGTTQTVDGQPYQIQFLYDLAGHLVQERYPTGRVVNTGYDVAGRVSSVDSPSGRTPYADQVQYAPHGVITQMLLGNGLWATTGFDHNRLQITEIDVGTSKGAFDVLSLQYDYHDPFGNNNGNVWRQMISAPGLAVTQLALYDPLNRLLQIQEVNGATVAFPFQTTAVWEQDFTHDYWGNRTALTSTSGLPSSVAPAVDTNNRIDVTKDNRYVYDAGGYLKQEPVGSGGTSGTNVYTYDAEGHLIRAQEGAATQAFKYDGLGNRVKKVAENMTAVYVHDVHGQLIAEYSTTAPQNNGTRYLTQDILGSERLVTGTDSSNNPTVVARYDYLPFGELIPVGLSTRSSVTGYGATDVIRQKFTGKERDSETGLDYFGKRYYSNGLGRWTSPDPKGIALRHLLNPQKLDKYSYVLNNPVGAFDPDGMEEITITYRTFIPPSSVTVMGKTNGGDNRSFSTAPNASSRTSITIRIETDPNIRPGNPIISVDGKPGNYTGHAGQSTTIKNGQVVSSSTATSGLPVATGTRDANGTPIINIQQNTKNPESPVPQVLTPGISANMNVMVYQDASTVQVTGTAAQFPASELNVTRADGTTTPVIQYMPPSDATPYSLLEPDRHINEKKETPACNGGDKGCPK